MTTLFGRPLSEARQRVGRLSQVARIDSFEEREGPARGARRLQLITGGGLTVDLHPDRALDIGAVYYRGVPLAWIAPPGIGAPSLTENRGPLWLRTFGGGLMTTCGLESYGPPSDVDGVEYPLHGRVSSIPATVTRAEITDRELIVEGEIRQSTVFSENLVLRRRITAPLGGSTLRVEDTVTNEASSEAGHMVLYHCNLGWPLIDSTSTLEIPSSALSPRDAAAEAGVASWHTLTGPVAGYDEQVFRHDFKGRDVVEVSVDNPAQDVRLALRFDTATLPALHQWKMLGEGHYVLGLEPTNVNWSLGRAKAQEEGVLPSLAPGDSVSYHLEFTAGPSLVTTRGQGRTP